MASANDEAVLASLTQAQRDSLATFREITAGERDLESSMQIMRSCDWDTERALHVHLAAADEPPLYGGTAHGSANAGPAPDLGAPLLGGGDGAPRGQSSGFVNMMRSNPIFGWFARGLRAFGSTLLGVLRFVLIGNGQLAAYGQTTSGAAFQRALSDSTGAANLPNFFEGSFNDALSAARQDLRLLVVYLHSDHSRFAQSFCTQILCNDFVKAVLEENFIVWGGNIAWMEATQVAQILHARQYPYFCVLIPSRGNEMRVIGALEGNSTVDAALALLTNCLEEIEQHRAEMVAHQAQQLEDRNLREQQDREYQEALDLDRMREEEKRKREMEEQEAARVAAEARRLEEEQEAKVRMELEAQKEARRQKAQTMPAEGPECTARISLRLPAGQRLQRKFRPDALLSEVYAWAECCAFLPENADRGIEVPRRFCLKTSFPSKELTEMDRTVRELELNGSNVLLAEIEDD